jgi:hypothetical protein
MGQDQLCDDEIGVDFSATCELQSDDRSVRVSGIFKLFEDRVASCGADDQEDEQSFDLTVAAGQTGFTNPIQLANEGVCFFGPFPADCDDFATMNPFSIENQRAP